MGKNAIVGQSGGPTSVINASLAGVFESCKSRGADIVYGMCNGVAGLLEERVVDLSTVLTDDLDIELLKRSPGRITSASFAVSVMNSSSIAKKSSDSRDLIT